MRSALPRVRPVRSRRRPAAWLAVALLASAALAGCAGTGPASAPGAAAGSTPAVRVLPAGERPSLPAVDGTSLDGARLALPDPQGRVTVVNAWASWCDPCRRELPVLAALAARVDAADIAFVGLNVNDEASKARAMAVDFGLPYPSIVDADARLRLQLPGVPPDGLPVTVVVDHEGRIAATVIGQVHAGDLEPVLVQLSAE